MQEYDPRERPGVHPHRSNRHKNRDNLDKWLGDQWEAARLFIPAEGETESFVQAFPVTEEGKQSAWRLSEELRALLKRQDLAGNGVTVLVEYRHSVGYGVWVILGKAERKR